MKPPVSFPTSRLRTAHLLVGAAGMVLFVLSGQYMHHLLGHLRELPDGPRLFYRTAHIYLMWASALNLLLGVHMQGVDGGGWRRGVQLAGSALILAAPLWIVLSFLTESTNADLVRPLGRIGIETAFGGTLLHALARLPRRARRGVPEKAPVVTN